MSKSQPQQQPLPQSIILGCNAFNCASKISNANFETKLNEQVIVNQGDSIGIKASFIDTRGTASGNIVIINDTEISLEYYFYYMHTFNACDPSGITTSSADASNNLTQQVLVGQSIPFLYNYNQNDLSNNLNIPSYLTVGDASGNYAATPINDADGLPYIVYQSSPVIPVPAIYGPTIPASDIVPGTNYVIVSAGLTTNWAYAGVPNASANILPAKWVLGGDPFMAVANPNGVDVPALVPLDTNPGMSPSEFLLPANVNPTLPYAQYMITVLGDTQWDVIDPNSVSSVISASQMVSGQTYIIDNPGNIIWTVLGAANNNTNTEFTYTNPPPAPQDFPITLNNAFFLANATAFINPGQPGFGANPSDNFQCVIGVDGTGNYTLVSYSGSGQWCLDISSTALWFLPPALLNINTTVCPTATALTITGFSSTSAGIVPVANLITGSSYTVATTGILDGSIPPFTWNMVSNLPTTDTTQMVAGNQYQVYEFNGLVIPYAPTQGVLTDVFISQGPIPTPPPTPPPASLIYTYNVDNLPDTPNFSNIVAITLDGALPFNSWTSGFQVYLEVTADGNGNCILAGNNSYIISPPNFFAGVSTIITTINGSAQLGLPSITVTFISISVNGDFNSGTIVFFHQNPPLVPYPTGAIGASLLVQLQGLVPSTETYTFDLNTPNISQLAYYNTRTIPYIYPGPGGVDPFSITLSADPNGSGNVYYVPYPVSIAQGPNWVSANAGSNSINMVINWTPAGFGQYANDFSSTNYDAVNIYSMVLNGDGSTLKFPTMLSPLPFIASGPYTGTLGSTSTANGLFGTLNAATVSGTGYLQGSVYTSPPQVGTIINSINPDPTPPSTGRAVEYPTPNPYDGTVKSYISPTFKTVIEPVKKKWKMTLKAGSYDPNFLAELISRNMSRQKVKRVNNVTRGPFGTQSTLTVPTDSIYNTQTAEWAVPLGGGQNTFYDSKNPKVYGYPSEIDYNINPDNDDMPFIFVPAMNSSYLHDTQPTNPPDYIYAEVPHPNANGLNNLPNPTYYINLVPLLSDVRSVSPTIPTDISGGYYTILPFYSQNTVAAGTTDGHGGIFPVAYGATQTSLLYNNEGNGLFSFNYLHSPILAFLSSATNDLTECTAHMFTTQKKSANMAQTNFFTTLIDKKSGILLNKMLPTSFWAQLGFDVPSLTVDLDNKPPGFQMTLNEFEARTTGGFCGSSNIFNGTFHTKGSADQPSVPDTELIFLTGVVGTGEGTAILPFTSNPPDTIPGNVYVINNLGTFVYYAGFPVPGPVTQTATDWSQYFTAFNTNENTLHSYSGMLVVSNGNWDGTNYYTNTVDSTTYWAWYDSGHESFNYPPPSVFAANEGASTTTQLQNNYFQVQNTNTLNALKIPTVRDQTGHFLIEIVAYNSVYLDDKSKREIKSIVSSYFVSQGSFVAQVFPESYNYYHVGAPISLSNLKIRILDPYTMEEAQIGPNSSVYIQVNKMLTDQAIAQIEN